MHFFHGSLPIVPISCSNMKLCLVNPQPTVNKNKSASITVPQ